MPAISALPESIRAAMARAAPPTLKRLLAGLLIGLAAAPAQAGPAATGVQKSQEHGRPVVVELFTSQGCSSCPPADRLLGELATRPDVLALSYNITYWDYLGWRDTLGREENTARQEAYARRFGHRKYTPQMVIDGATHLPGGRRDEVLAAIAARAASRPSPEGVTIRAQGDAYRLNADARGRGTATIWLVHYDTRHEVTITRGENAGRTVTYANVVRHIEPVASWDLSTPLALEISGASVRAGGHDGCAVLVQQDHAGPVIAAARLDAAALVQMPRD